MYSIFTKTPDSWVESGLFEQGNELLTDYGDFVFDLSLYSKATSTNITDSSHLDFGAFPAKSSKITTVRRTGKVLNGHFLMLTTAIRLWLRLCWMAVVKDWSALSIFPVVLRDTLRTIRPLVGADICLRSELGALGRRSKKTKKSGLSVNRVVHSTNFFPVGRI